LTTATLPAFTGAVLTGGRSRRMGIDKAFLEVHGRPMAARAASALRQAGAVEVAAVGGAGDRLLELGFDRFLPDDEHAAGPLGGLLTALRAARDAEASAGAGVVVVLACDLPDVSVAGVDEVVQALGEHAAAIPFTDRLEPLHAAWRAEACLAHLSAAFAAGERAVHRAVEGLDVVRVALTDPGVVRNVNQPSDLPR
jgi:molybdopterin-guanine dinucleotide biosynthesis protein A